MLKKNCLLLLLTLLLLPALSLAETLAPEVHAIGTTANPGGPVQVTIDVTNPNDEALPVALYDPNGMRVADFPGELSAGASHTWNGSWQLTQEHLSSGKLPFAVAWARTDAAGRPVMRTQTYYIPLASIAEQARLLLTVSADPAMCLTFPGVVRFTFHLTNLGDLPAVNIRLTTSDGIQIYPLEGDVLVLAPGKTIAIQRDLRVPAPGAYRFDAQMETAQGTSLCFHSNEVSVRLWDEDLSGFFQTVNTWLLLQLQRLAQ